MPEYEDLEQEEWLIRENWIAEEKMPGNESLFALANGYLGIRGTLEENSYAYQIGTYINGFYDINPLQYDETAYGYAKNSQTMLNLPDGRYLTFYLDDEPFDITQGAISYHNRWLDLRRGILFREAEWQSPSGRAVRLYSERIVSLTRPYCAAIKYTVEPLQEGSFLRIVSMLDGNVRNLSTAEDPRTGSRLGGEALRPFGGKREDHGGVLRARTKASGLALATAVTHSWRGLKEPVSRCSHENQRILFELEGKATANCPVTVYKYITYYAGVAGEEERLEGKALKALNKAKREGFGQLYREQKKYLDNFWQHSDVKIEGDPQVQQSLRFNLFHLLQSVGKDGNRSISAKGLTGEGYEGHYFWDTEIYVLPFFIYTDPSVARKILTYRHTILPMARNRAEELSQKGALFPWRTINGEEASAYFPAGTAQYHINADIAYGIKKYLQITGDLTFLPYAAEILTETARFWTDLGSFIPKRGGAFCINCVTGPDEYTALVDNNYYTNIMAKDNLLFALETVSRLLEKEPEMFKTLARELSFTVNEMEDWRRAAQGMYLPYDEELGIHPQDDSFLYKTPWNLAEIPLDKRPLLLHYHPLVIYRYQILKQADLVLAEFLQGENFSQAEKRRDFNYYDPITLGDSSLSPCVQGVMAAEIGYLDKSYEYFMKTARIDLDDLNGNVKDGVHTAAMAGTWISLVYGFAGLRDHDGILRFNPEIPKQWNSLSFHLNYHNSLLEVSITKREVRYKVKKGEEVNLIHQGKPYKVGLEEPLIISLEPVLEAVIFDLDGVITDSAEYHYQAWKELCRDLDIPFNREINESLKGISRRESLEVILSKSTRFYSEQEKIKLAEKKNKLYRELIERIKPEDLLPGIKEFIQDLKREGIKIALASASRNSGRILQLLDLEGAFDVVADPNLVKMGKPDPEQFYLAAEMLNVPYRNCAGIEDSQAGIEAIRSGGMFAVGIGENLHGADWICKSSSELSLKELKERFFSVWV